MKLCPFCHSWVSENIWDSHLDSHTRLLPDGQMQDHITLRPEERFSGSIDQEPQWYVHAKCGEVTGMPDEIIRSYLADPFLYNDNSFCSGCGTYVPLAELFWQETNESLLSADRRRKLEFIQRNRLPPNDFVWDAHGPVQRKSQPGGGAESQPGGGAESQPSGGVESQPGGGVGWGVAVIAAGGAMALFLLGMVCLGLLTFGARARARPVQPAAFPARPGRNFGRPGFAGPDFARPELPEREVRKSPDLGEIRQEHERQMDRLRKQNDELLNRLRSRNPAQP